MHVTMVKKRLKSGEPCRKCAQAEEMLRNRGLWARIDAVVWADENDSASPGVKLAEQHQVDLAPFFIVRNEQGRETVYTSAIKFVKEALQSATAAPPQPQTEAGGQTGESWAPSAEELHELQREFANAPPSEILRVVLDRFGSECAISFSGAEDVVLIDMASKLGLPFSVFSLDTGRLHAETYRFIDKVRDHYGIEISLYSPDPGALEPLVRKKGLFSFYQDGHEECCGIRKVEPLGRALSNYRAWVTGQRKDQSITRTALNVIALDQRFSGKASGLVKLNPLANWSSQDVWDYIRSTEVPYNELHERGYVSIGCEPCTRAIQPGEHERAGRWWWEAETRRECGLHVRKESG